MTDYQRAVAAILGVPRQVFAGHSTWGPLEEFLGTSLPEDYKKLVDEYAPVQVNSHLYLEHPANTHFPLGQWISEVVEDFRGIEWEPAASCPGFEDDGPTFGSRSGMIPLASTDRGEYVFLAPGIDGDRRRILSCGRSEQDFYEYRMDFTEWLYRYLRGEEMFEPGHSDLYPGPVRLESLPTSGDDPKSEWYGPDRDI
ncbi:SMI1/KNR4 family protein [Streptomyces sp. NPDC058700]|uniref:SMI1/KNR4 family protein n=1 Tax=Streptomyces sp. NPDC058700 TaxID=3346607 RepID=UPI0036699EB0